jgi:transcriptional regulator with XRE-family HTH domain
MMSKNLLYTLRIEKGLTLNQLAQKIGVHSSSISKWENGKAAPSEMRLRRIASVFETDFDSLSTLFACCAIKGCMSHVHDSDFCKSHYDKYGIRLLNKGDVDALPDMGKRLRFLREKNSISLEQFARSFGVTNETVEAWEENYIKPSLCMLVDISARFKIGTRWLERGVIENA